MSSRANHSMSTMDVSAAEPTESKSGVKGRFQPISSKRRRKIRLITPEVLRQFNEAYDRNGERAANSEYENEKRKDEKVPFSTSNSGEEGIAVISSSRPINKEIAQEYSLWCENFLDNFPILYQSLQLQNGRSDALAFISQIFRTIEQKAKQGTKRPGPSNWADAPAEPKPGSESLPSSKSLGGEPDSQTVANSENRLKAYFQEMLHEKTLRECISKLVKIFRDLQRSSPRASICADAVGKLDMYNSKKHKVSL